MRNAGCEPDCTLPPAEVPAISARGAVLTALLLLAASTAASLSVGRRGRRTAYLFRLRPDAESL